MQQTNVELMLDRAEFDAYLASIPERKIAGRVGNTFSCPIACYLLQKYSGVVSVWSTNNTCGLVLLKYENCVDGPRAVHVPTPDWALRFQILVDKLEPQVSITAGRARRILASIPDEGEAVAV